MKTIKRNNCPKCGVPYPNWMVKEWGQCIDCRMIQLEEENKQLNEAQGKLKHKLLDRIEELEEDNFLLEQDIQKLKYRYKELHKENKDFKEILKGNRDVVNCARCGHLFIKGDIKVVSKNEYICLECNKR